MTDYLIEKCQSCERYDHVNHKMRNKLKCMIDCEDYQLDQSIRIFQYNRTVSDNNFDNQIMYEHGKEVYGSGWEKNE